MRGEGRDFGKRGGRRGEREGGCERGGGEGGRGRERLYCTIKCYSKVSRTSISVFKYKEK